MLGHKSIANLHNSYTAEYKTESALSDCHCALDVTFLIKVSFVSIN